MIIMISLNLNNIEIIKNYHKEYTDVVVKDNYKKFKSENKVNYKVEIFDFIERIIEKYLSKEIYIAELDILLKFKEYYSEKIEKMLNEYEEDKRKEISEQIETSIKKIFNYKQFTAGRKIELNGTKAKWGRTELLNLLDTTVCPYCNRQYITSYIFEEEKKQTADADHYICKSEYPILAIALYNLIPSCKICNQTLKGNSNSEHLYPYNRDIDKKLKFEIVFDNELDYYKINQDIEDFNIIINDFGNSSSKASKEVFKLEEIYKFHRTDIKMLLENIKKYKDIEKLSSDELINMFSISYLEKMIFDFIDDDLDSKPLTKLKKDIKKAYY